MSFFDMLKQKANETRSLLAGEVSKYRNREFMESCVAGCVLVAAADGEIESAEKQKMMRFIQQSEELKIFTTQDVIDYFNKVAGNFDFDTEIGKAEAFKAVGKLRTNPDAARLMVRVCMAIGSSDGDFDDNEKQVVREISRELGLNPADFGL